MHYCHAPHATLSLLQAANFLNFLHGQWSRGTPLVCFPARFLCLSLASYGNFLRCRNRGVFLVITQNYILHPFSSIKKASHHSFSVPVVLTFAALKKRKKEKCTVFHSSPVALKSFIYIMILIQYHIHDWHLEIFTSFGLFLR